MAIVYLHASNSVGKAVLKVPFIEELRIRRDEDSRSLGLQILVGLAIVNSTIRQKIGGSFGGYLLV